MKRYHFSLEAVLRVRRAQEEAAGFALAHANQQRQRAMEAHEKALALCRAIELRRGPQDHVSFQQERDVTERRAVAVTVTQQAVTVATDEATARLADWSAAAKLVAAVERLDNRRREEWRLEEQRLETAAIDESAIAGWLADTAASVSAPAVLGVGT
jgi:flagellar biosynthesis chaperone FliJ